MGTKTEKMMRSDNDKLSEIDFIQQLNSAVLAGVARLSDRE